MPMQTNNEFDLSEQIAVVTGAGRGLGHDISLALARYGAHVVACSRTESQLETVAEKIKEIARENEVPIIEDKPLAQALHKMVEIGEFIPAELYRTVAEVLAYVYRLKGMYQTA